MTGDFVMQKKIVIVTPWFDGFVGGAGTLAKGMARELNRRGVSASVFTTCSRSPYDDWWSDYYPPGRSVVEGIETHRFRVNQTRAPYDATIKKIAKGNSLTPDDERNFFQYGINSDELVTALADVLDKDHEIVALPYFQGLTYSALKAYPGRISLIPCFHDEPQFYWRSAQMMLSNAKHVFYNSLEEKEMTIRQYGRAVGRRIVEGAVTGVGVEMSAIDDDSTSLQSLPQKYFIYAGRKEKGKNVPLLCEWFIEYVRQSATATKLVFVGGGEKQLLPQSPHIIDLGAVSDADKRRAISAARALINLSHQESFSIVVMEAWLSAVPVIVSHGCAVTAGHVRRANGGVVVDNQAEFSAACNYLDTNEAVRSSLGINGKIFVAREFSYDVVLAKYLRVFAANGRPHVAAAP